MTDVTSTLPAFLLQRLIRALLLTIVVSSAALTLVHLAPGDAFSDFTTDPETAAAERARYGLDRPFLQQYVSWLGRAVTLDLGDSTRFRRPVAELLVERLPLTFMLGVAALCIVVGLGIPLGVAGGARPNRWWARATRGWSMLMVSIPPLVMSLALLLLAARTGWLPAGGLNVESSAPLAERLALTLRSLILPSLALGLPIAASVERLQASALMDALREPCVRAALARGVTDTRVIWNHAFRLSLKPVLAIFGVIVGTVLSGSLIVEIVMSWPGIGELMYQALVSRDLHLAGGCAATASVFLAAGVLLSDVALALVDPRVRGVE
jgi:peptide/nickel transport system permease protein